MIQDLFYFFNDIGFPVHIGIETSHYISSLSGNLPIENKLNSEKHGVIWIRKLPNTENIQLFETNSRIMAYPSPDFKFVVALYDGYNSTKFPAPSNVVVYNENGTIHKIISCPILKTPDRDGKFVQGYKFNNIGWTNNKKGEVTIYLDIEESSNAYIDWYERREFNPETGEFGEFLHRGKS